jgi:hypothetical protein
MGLAAFGLGLAIAGRLLAEIPAAVEWHRSRFFPAVAATLQGMSGGSASTLGEVGAAIVIAAALAFLACRPKLAGGLVSAAGLLVLTFYFLWGFGYQYPQLTTRLEPLVDHGQAQGEVLSELAGRVAAFVSLASEAGPSFSGSDTEFLARTNSGLDRGFSAWPPALEAAPVHGVAFGPVKSARVSFAMSRMQISGYYFPWTGEAQINTEMPRTLWPRVAGHEKAHQRGFARENEASVVGLVACLDAQDPAVVYSGALGLFVAVDREVARTDQELRRRMWKALPARVSADLRTEAAFWKAREGVGGKVSEKVNDTYLKAQGVRSGVGSYAETTRLILQVLETEALDLGRRLPRPDALLESK